MPDALGSAVTNTTPNSCVVVQSSRLCKPWVASSQISTFMAVWESGRLNGVTRIFHSDHSHIDAPVSEGFILLVYPDDRGNPTVGCGHLVLPEDNLRLGQTISVQRAREFLKKDLKRTERAINSKVHVPLFEYEYDALVSISFNAGAGHAADELTRRVNQGDYENIPDYIKSFRCGPSLRHRRRTEARIFFEGVYDASH
ncbi:MULTISPECIES: lysozyme [Paraburkholderia]|uniref:Lysozyme n=1 Tax=Paraburkholderia podalyriae TaxID=1938811 RepID=A0ABR7PQY6_9BURK|nr:lysozyme [Paraburkholderia podalyriae]MBC8748669.1 lysozyme [Paraburkholderia podalyriae]